MAPFFIALCIAISIFIVTSITVWICRRHKQKRFLGEVIEAPVVVTSATHTAPGGYAVTQMPISSSTTAYQYAAPYPTQGAQMPMPMPVGQPGSQSYATPYPPMPMPANMNPPSYDSATGTAGFHQQNTNIYEKQSAYNPNY